jgi:hypothetical protein
MITIAIKPAAGPLIVRGEPHRGPTIRPPIIAVTTPPKAGNPLAIAIPKQRGSATSDTSRPATKSPLQFSFKPFRPSEGVKWETGRKVPSFEVSILLLVLNNES